MNTPASRTAAELLQIEELSRDYLKPTAAKLKCIHGIVSGLISNPSAPPAAPAVRTHTPEQIAQALLVMDEIGPLLDAWDGLGNDVKECPREEGFEHYINRLKVAIVKTVVALKKQKYRSSGKQ